MLKLDFRMDFLQHALAAIPKAAQNPLALVAYLATIIAWLIIAIRVRRNKNLLVSLDKLPDHQRLEALRLEMGEIPIPERLSPSQWLKARIHRYYFWGFAMICVVVVVLFAIAAFGSANVNDELHSSVKAIQDASSSITKVNDPVEKERLALAEMGLGIQREFVVSKLGVPQNETKYKTVTCAAYELQEAKAYFIYDNNTGTVQFYSLTATNKSYHPIFGELPKECIGCKSFQEIESTPLYFNWSSKIWVYTETNSVVTAASDTTYFFTNRYGADYDDPDATTLNTTDVRL